MSVLCKPASSIRQPILIPCDGTLANVIRILPLLEQPTKVILYYPSNMFASDVGLHKQRLLHTLSTALHHIGTSEPLILVVDTIPAHDGTTTRSLDAASPVNLSQLFKHMVHQATTMAARVGWPSEWVSASAECAVSQTNVIVPLPAVVASTDTYSTTTTTTMCSLLHDVWNAYVNAVQDHYTVEELNDAETTQDLLALLQDVIPVDPSFELWDAMDICPGVQCTSGHQEIRSCCYSNTCDVCSQFCQYVEENCVPRTIMTGVTDG